ncbi:dihydroorotate dehydrogenase electron transfer subunit [Chloroflexota bacterium]
MDNSIRQTISPVVSNTEETPGSGSHLLWLEAPEIAGTARPGQFVMVRCGDRYDPPLRRPLSINKVANGKQIALFFKTVGKGTEWLSRCQAGDHVNLLGPLGNGFSIQPSSSNLLLVAGGIGIAPLVFLAEKALKKRYSVTLLMGARHYLYPNEQLPSKINLHIFTEDGSEGKKGMVTDFIADFIPWADQIFTCGPAPMYQSIASQSNLKGKSVQISLEARMGCGLGACYSCTIKTKKGMRQVCQDGPVFELDDVLL